MSHSSATENAAVSTCKAEIQLQVRSQGGTRNLRPSPLFSYLPSLSPLEVGPLKSAGERCKLLQWGPRQSPSRKRIWCTLKLSESHWWQSFLNNPSTMFYSKTIKNLALANMIVSDGVSPLPKGGGRSRLGSPLNPPLFLRDRIDLYALNTSSEVIAQRQ